MGEGRKHQGSPGIGRRGSAWRELDARVAECGSEGQREAIIAQARGETRQTLTSMLSPIDLLAFVLVVAAVIFLNVPKLLLPALFLTALGLSVHRWRREGSKGGAAERYRWQLFASCVVIAVISVPLILGLVPANGVYGFRTRLTRSSPDIWYPANAFMGWALLVAACVSAAALCSLPRLAGRRLLLVTFLLPLLCAVVASFIYLERLA